MTNAVNLASAAGAVNGSGSNLQFNSGYGSVATAYGCRAWVNFNGTGTPSIRASGNVSSITDLGTGNYRLNFASSMPDALYAIVASTETGGGSGNKGPYAQTYNTGSAEIIVYSGTGSFVDATIINAAIFR